MQLTDSQVIDNGRLPYSSFSLQESTLMAYLISATSLKFVALLHRFVSLMLTETFFIDWERPKVKNQSIIIYSTLLFRFFLVPISIVPLLSIQLNTMEQRSRPLSFGGHTQLFYPCRTEQNCYFLLVILYIPQLKHIYKNYLNSPMFLLSSDFNVQAHVSRG